MASIQEKANLAMEGIANDLMNELVIACPVDKGTLKNSIDVSGSGQEWTISMLDYWKYVEFGTVPHVIKPVNKKALHWKSGGEDVFAKEVHHPGTRPQPFIRPALHQKLGRIIERNFRRQFEA